MTNSRKKMGLVTVLVAGLLVTACVFTGIVGVGDLTETRVVGILSLNELQEHSRAYVGLSMNDVIWDSEARVASIDVATGVEMGSTPVGMTGPWRIRSVATDPNTDKVWTLHDNGSIVEWPLDLGNWTDYELDFFEAPAGSTVIMFCDFEILSNGHRVGTGIAEDGGQYIGFYSYVQPHPSFPGEFYKSYTSWDIDVDPNLIRSCPRVSTDSSTGEVVFLIADASYLAGSDCVERDALYSWDGGGGDIYWGLSYVSQWALPTDTSFIPDDITSEFGKTVVQSEYVDLFNGRTHGKLRLYDTATATLEDTRWMYETRAVDMTDYIVNSNYLGGVLWWSGHDDASEKEIGIITLGTEE